MELIDNLFFRVLASVGTFFLVWLLIGQRQVSEFSPLEFVISITAGTVAGAVIADTRLYLANAVVALIILGALQVCVNLFAIKNRYFNRKINHVPIVVIENGQMVKNNMAKARLTVETLLQLLREKEIFNIKELELAILEPHGKLSILRKAEYLPVTPQKMNLKVEPNSILLPVILEGILQEKTLMRLGLSSEEIKKFRDKYIDTMAETFVAFMNQDQEVFIIKGDFSDGKLFDF